MIKPMETPIEPQKEYVTVPDPLSVREVDPKLLDPHGLSGAQTTLPGFDGFPFRGPVPDLKEKDSRQPEIGVEARVDILDLAVPADLEKYRQIMQLVGHSYAQISVEERQWVEAAKSWKVFLRWVLYYTYLPPARIEQVTAHG